MEDAIAFSKFSRLPAELKAEAIDFIEFLLSKDEKSHQPGKPEFGSGKGMFKMKDDFDEPLEDFKEYMS